MNRNKVFIGYSHKDTVWLEELRPHLGSLARERGFETLFWDDSKIKAGSRWREEIDLALGSAKVAILLVSKYFLDSEFITENELPPLLEAANNESALILPVILAPCRYAHHPALSRFQSVNAPEKSLESMSKAEYESLFLQITELVDEGLFGQIPTPAGSPADAMSEPKTQPAKTASHAGQMPPVVSVSAEIRQLLARDLNSSWRRVVIQSLADGGLHYQMIKDELRHDEIVLPPQRELVDDLVQRVSGFGKYDENLAGVLYELLVPNKVKSHLFHEGGTVLVLDSTTAHFPWEMLRDNYSADHRPVSIRFPVVRQMLAEKFSPQPTSDQRSALVIGNPFSESSYFMDLAGAVSEAENVTQLFKSSGFEVDSQIRKPAADAMVSIFSGRYKFLHMTGNGVHEFEVAGTNRKVTGFVLGDGMFFTASEIAQMRTAPEIVFMNACALGRDIPVAAEASQDASANYAASLPRQFLAIGSHGVIAPFETVDDKAAETFGVAFYEALIRGTSFGHSVLAARRKTFEQHDQNNTWGMYLCYGNPEYRLAGGH